MFELCAQGITDQLHWQKCQIEKITTSCSPIVWSAGHADDVTASAYIYTSKEPVCPRVELLLKIIIILLIIFLGFIKSKPC